jgi:hypothetical protein
MKKLIMLFVVCFGLSTLVGCSPVMSPITGIVFTELKAPFYAGDGQDLGSKEGRAECRGYLGLVAIGDASIKKAMEEGKITNVKAIDYEAFNILGVFCRFVTIVYGD